MDGSWDRLGCDRASTARSNHPGETTTLAERLFGCQGKYRTGVCPERVIVLRVDSMARSPARRSPSAVRDRRPATAAAARSPTASARCSSSSTPRSASGATRRACGRSARPSGCRRRPRCTRTSPPSRTRATSAATRASPARSRSRSSRAPAPPSSAARSATSRSLGDVAAGTGVLAAEHVEEVMPAPRGLHRRRRALHAAGPRRVDDRRRHLRRRLRRRARPSPTPTTATSSWPASPARRRR